MHIVSYATTAQSRFQMVVKYRVENQVEKQSRVHEHPTGPAGPACAPRPRARVRVVGGPGRVMAGPPVRVAVLRPRPALRLPRAPPAACPTCLSPARPAARAPAASCARAPAARPPRAPAEPSAVSWPGWPCRGPVLLHSLATHCPNCHNTIFVLRYKFFPCQPSCHNTKHCIAIQFHAVSLLQYKSCNTILAYTSLNHKTKYCITIQTALKSLSLQYN